MKTRSDDLELLLSVVDCGGFSAAAEVLGIQVARVSRAVSRIEQQLGVTLLNRTTRRLELTEEGHRFVDSVRGGLLALQQAEEAVHGDDRVPSGRLRVDAASPFALHQLIPLVSEFRRLYPQLALELTAHEGFIDLLEQRVDVAIRIGALQDSRLSARLLGHSPLYIVAAPDYLARHGMPDTPGALRNHDLLGFVGSKRLNRWPLAGFTGFTPDLAASNGEVVRQLALAGNGIACLSRFMIQDDLNAGRLVPLLQDHVLEDQDREQVHAVYYRSSQVSRRIRVFLDFIQSRLTL